MASQGTERRLAAILSADVVGYSRHMAEDEGATVRTVTAYRQEVELHVGQHRGRLVDFTGDNFLAEFPSALEAVQCAVEIQRVLGAMNADLPEDRRMEFRMGIHLGDVRSEGERLFGTGVNVAARLEGLAEPGGLCISGTVHEQVRANLDLRFDDLREQSVKNLPDPVHAYRLRLDAEPGRTAPSRWTALRLAGAAGGAALLVVLAWLAYQRLPLSTPAPGPIRSIAVLPLENLSGDPDQEYFADGLTDALIGELAQLGSLRVISRTSVMQYKRAPKHLPEIAEELDVDAVVEGTVLRDQDRVRITIQLVDARSDTHLWASRYDRELADVLDLQAEVARAVAREIELELTPDERARLATQREIEPRAIDPYLRGVQQLRSWRFPGGLRETISYLERATELSPDYAPAHARLAEAYVSLSLLLFGLPAHEAMPKARTAALRALELDDGLGAAHAALGRVYLHYDWNWEAAGREFERAVELAPSDPLSLEAYAFYLAVSGRAEESIPVVEQAVAAAPMDPSVRVQMARLLTFAGRDRQALEEARGIVESYPEFAAAYLVLGLASMGLGEEKQANEAWLELDRLSGIDSLVEARRRGWLEGGFQGANRAWVETLTKGRAGPEFADFNAASVWWLAGETDKAFESLERAYRDREPGLVTLGILGELARRRGSHISDDPRFDDLVRRIGIPES